MTKIEFPKAKFIKAKKGFELVVDIIREVHADFLAEWEQMDPDDKMYDDLEEWLNALDDLADTLENAEIPERPGA